MNLCDRSTEATPHAVCERLGDPVRYYATATTCNPVPWDKWFSTRWPDCGFGEARAPDDWRELHIGETARVLSVTPEAVRWTTERAEPHIRLHAELFCAGDAGDQVRTGWVTRVDDDTLQVAGTMSTPEGGWASLFE